MCRCVRVWLSTVLSHPRLASTTMAVGPGMCLFIAVALLTIYWSDFALTSSTGKVAPSHNGLFQLIDVHPQGGVTFDFSSR